MFGWTGQKSSGLFVFLVTEHQAVSQSSSMSCLCLCCRSSSRSSSYTGSGSSRSRSRSSSFSSYSSHSSQRSSFSGSRSRWTTPQQNTPWTLAASLASYTHYSCSHMVLGPKGRPGLCFGTKYTNKIVNIELKWRICQENEQNNPENSPKMKRK